MLTEGRDATQLLLLPIFLARRRVFELEKGQECMAGSVVRLWLLSRSSLLRVLDGLQEELANPSQTRRPC